MIEIELSKTGWKYKGKYVALVDDKYDYLAELNWTAEVDKTIIYATHKIDSKKTYLHRLILAEKISRPLLDTEEVDHIDGNGLNCLENNLRVASRTENNQNKGLQSSNKSGIKGVHWAVNAKKWRAEIRVNGKKVHLGLFNDLNDAAEAYAIASKAYHKEFSRIS